MAFDRMRPFNDLPLLPPKKAIETPAVLKKAIAASRALAELKGSGNVLPNQDVLINSIVLQEARSSSEIENIVTTNDELYRAASGVASASDEAKEVLRYREALWQGYKLLNKRALSTRMFVEIARTIRGVALDIRRTPGTRISDGAGNIVYTPPDGEAAIREKLADLERFIHADDGLDPMVRMAVAHYQFEAIHPFTDGNGRTGRIINILLLVEQGLLDVPVLFLSGFIMANRAAYYEGLRRVTEAHRWEEWVLYMLEAVADTATATRERVTRIQRQMADAQRLIRKKAPKIYSKELVELLFTQPYCKISTLVDARLVKRQAASQYLQTLENIGFVKGHRAGREVYYVNTRLVRALKG
jgi:Fic family protein